MSWTNDFLDGLSRFLNAAGVATYIPSQNYRDENRNLLPGVIEPVITWARMPDGPTKTITLSAYTSTDDFVLSDVTQRVQVLMRGTADIRIVNAIRDSVFEVLHGVVGLRFNGIAITDVRRISALQLPPDDAGRWLLSDNYAFSAAHPTASRPD